MVDWVEVIPTLEVCGGGVTVCDVVGEEIGLWGKNSESGRTGRW